MPVAAQRGVVQVAAEDHSVAVKRDGSVVVWGRHYEQPPVPAGLDDVAQVDAGALHTVALVGRARITCARSAQSVRENAHSTSVTVTRGGNTAIPAQVRYARTAGTATPGSDFTLVPGTLTFAANEISQTIPLAISDDQAREAAETIVISLSSPGSGTTLGTRSSTTLTIARSDQQPDALISTQRRAGFIGNNVYNTTGDAQTKTRKRRTRQDHEILDPRPQRRQRHQHHRDHGQLGSTGIGVQVQVLLRRHQPPTPSSPRPAGGSGSPQRVQGRRREDRGAAHRRPGPAQAREGHRHMDRHGAKTDVVKAVLNLVA